MLSSEVTRKKERDGGAEGGGMKKENNGAFVIFRVNEGAAED